MIRIDRFERIGDLDRDAWERAVGRRPFLSPRWLAWAEGIQDDARSAYVVAHSHGAAGGMLCSIRSREQLPISHPLLLALVERYLQKRPLILCQAPLVGLSALSDPVPNALMARLLEAARELVTEAKASFLIFPYLSELQTNNRVWDPGFSRVRMPPNYYLPIRWASFDGYIASRRRSVRKDYRLHANRKRRLGLETSVCSELPNPARALELIRRHERRHGAAPHPWAERLVQEPMQEQGRWLLVKQGERLLGCGLALSDRRRLSLTLLGLDPAVPQVYFSLMYGAVKFAIENGAEGIYGGGGAEQFKARLGYAPLNANYVRVYAANPYLSRLGRWLAAQETALEPGRLDFLRALSP